MGLSGLGDLVLTCSSRQSRNFSLGVALGEGQRLEDYLAGRRTVAEGMYSASAVCRMAEDAGVEMPIAAAVDAVLNRGAAIDSMAETLLQRPLRSESA
jgi:glycerol-3-phosphate dehydrogenase (NAD(P)+)